MVLNQREIIIGTAGIAIGVVATIGVQKGAKAWKSRAAKKKAEKAIVDAVKEGKEPFNANTTSAAGKTTKETVDMQVDSTLKKLPGESDADYKKRMDHIISQVDEAKHSNTDSKAKATA